MDIAKHKVVTITLNPALDLNGSVTELKLGSVNNVNTGSLHAAGKGINVAQVLADLGAEVTVTGFLGQENETLFCQLFARIKAQDKFIRLAGSTRTNVKLLEASGQVSDINFPGLQVTPQAISAFENTLFELADTHDFFVLAGSLPQGVTPTLCASWIEKLTQRGKKVIFDSSGAALQAGIAASPWLIKPNEHELATLIGHSLTSQSAYQAAAEKVAKQGLEHVVVSRGEKGVMWLSRDSTGLAVWRYAKPPKMDVISTVGAGDSLVAGFCWGAMQAWPAQQTLCFATALSVLAVSQVAVGVNDLSRLTDLQSQVVIE